MSMDWNSQLKIMKLEFLFGILISKSLINDSKFTYIESELYFRKHEELRETVLFDTADFAIIFEFLIFLIRNSSNSLRGFFFETIPIFGGL